MDSNQNQQQLPHIKQLAGSTSNDYNNNNNNNSAEQSRQTTNRSVSQAVTKQQIASGLNSTGLRERSMSKGSTKNVISKEQNTNNNNIKAQFNLEKMDNQAKFQDAFFIKIEQSSDYGGENNLKIVRSIKEKDKLAAEQFENSSVSSIDESDQKKQSIKVGSGAIKIREGRKKSVVKEVQEEYEQSPKHQKGQQVLQRQNKSKSPPVATAGNKKMSTIPRVDDDYTDNNNAGNKSGVKKKVSQYEQVSVGAISNTEAKTIPPLVKFDLNLDILKNYIEEIQDAINSHAQQINGLQVDIKQKAYERTVGHYFLKISESLHKECGEKPHQLRIEDQSQVTEFFLTDDSAKLKKGCEKVGEKFEIIGLNIISLQKFKTDAQERLERMERALPKCFTIDQFREDSQQQEQRTMKYINEQLGNFQENLNSSKKDLAEALTFFEKKVNEFQQDTVWKINDCQDLLKSRVSEKYVNNAIQTLDDKLTKQTNYSDVKQIERLEKSFKELGQRIVQTNTFVNDKFEDSRKLLSQYDTKLQNVATMDRLAVVQTGTRDMKYNFERELEMLQEHIKEAKDKIGELFKKVQHFELGGLDFPPPIMQQNQHSIMPTSSRNHNGNNNNNNTTGGSGSQKEKNGSNKAVGMAQPISPMLSPLKRKKAANNQGGITGDIEKKFQRYDDHITYLEEEVNMLKKALEQKLQQFEEIQEIQTGNVSRDELIQMLPSEDAILKKVRMLIREDIDGFQKQFQDQIKQWDHKMVKIRNELDVHFLTKQLDKKANELEVRNDFNNHEFKISALDRNIISMATDFETVQSALNQMHYFIVELQEANREVLLGKKQFNCLSCGGGAKGTQAETLQSIRGKDGRFYRGESLTGGAGGQSMRMPTNEDSIIRLNQQQQSHLNNSIINNNNNQLGFDNNYSPMTQSNQKHSIPPVLYQDFVVGGGMRNQMKSSLSFYEQANSAYDNHATTVTGNLPQVHKKLNSHGSLALRGSSDGIASTSGLQSITQTQSQNTSVHQNMKLNKKLPFGFQVQQEKKELFKVTTIQNKDIQRQAQNALNKSGFQSRARPETGGHKSMSLLNRTYD